MIDFHPNPGTTLEHRDWDLHPPDGELEWVAWERWHRPSARWMRLAARLILAMAAWVMIMWPVLIFAHPVKRWAPIVEQECKRAEIEPCPTLQTLALIDVESDGRPAHRKSPRSQYFGLLQIGSAAAAELGADASDTHGDGRLAIRLHLQLRKRYARRWNGWAPSVGVALFWKMGPGALRRVRKRVSGGQDLERAVGVVSVELGLGRSREYLRRYLEALRKLQGVTTC